MFLNTRIRCILFTEWAAGASFTAGTHTIKYTIFNYVCIWVTVVKLSKISIHSILKSNTSNSSSVFKALLQSHFHKHDKHSVCHSIIANTSTQTKSKLWLRFVGTTFVKAVLYLWCIQGWIKHIFHNIDDIAVSLYSSERIECINITQYISY